MLDKKVITALRQRANTLQGAATDECLETADYLEVSYRGSVVE